MVDMFKVYSCTNRDDNMGPSGKQGIGVASRILA